MSNTLSFVKATIWKFLFILDKIVSGFELYFLDATAGLGIREIVGHGSKFFQYVIYCTVI